MLKTYFYFLEKKGDKKWDRDLRK